MRPPLIAAIAGVPGEIGQEFVAKFRGNVTATSIISWLPLKGGEPYTNAYANELYNRIFAKLRKREKVDHDDPLSGTNLILLYVERKYGTESVLVNQFGIEAIVAPLKVSDIEGLPLSTGNQRQRAVKMLVRESHHAIKSINSLLSVIAEEVTNRDNRTCLLLPRKNFGNDIKGVFDCVHDAASNRIERDQFKRNIDLISRQLRTAREGRGTYFMGRSGIIFKSPSKARGRHALAPTWDTTDHEATCIIRGRMRFGTSYNPMFHYDCAITRNASRRFSSCHGEKAAPRGRTHVNIAPNDNVR